jgi:hypothetical protein
LALRGLRFSLNPIDVSNDTSSGGGSIFVFVIVGAIIVIVCVFGGFILDKGNIMVLVQPTEFLIIGGAAIGSLILSCAPSLLKAIMGQVIGTITSKGITKQDYSELLMCIYELTKTLKLAKFSKSIRACFPITMPFTSFVTHSRFKSARL